MATTKESMKVIAGGLDKKEKPEVVMEGKVIAVEVPDELAEAFEKLVGGMITKCEDKGNLHSENDQNDGGHAKDEDSEPTEVQELVMDIAFMLGSRASDHLMMIKEKNDLSTEAMLPCGKKSKNSSLSMNMSAMRVRSPEGVGSGRMLLLNYRRKIPYGIVVCEQGKRNRNQYESTEEINYSIYYNGACINYRLRGTE